MLELGVEIAGGELWKNEMCINQLDLILNDLCRQTNTTLKSRLLLNKAVTSSLCWKGLRMFMLRAAARWSQVGGNCAGSRVEWQFLHTSSTALSPGSLVCRKNACHTYVHNKACCWGAGLLSRSSLTSTFTRVIRSRRPVHIPLQPYLSLVLFDKGREAHQHA
jgi:hypothetical protein